MDGCYSSLTMRTFPLLLAALVLLPVVALAGCTSGSPRPASTPVHRPATVIFSGTESGEQDILAPAGSHSAAITVVCSGEAVFSLYGALNPKVDGLSGACDLGTHRYQMTVEALRKLHLQIELTKAGRFVVETQFSPARLVRDDELSAQCGAMVTVGSDVSNAADGFTRGKLSVAQWQQRMSDADNTLESLTPEKTNILSDAVKRIHRDITVSGLTPTSFSSSAPSDYGLTMNIVGQVCSDNGTAIYVNDEFGG